LVLGKPDKAAGCVDCRANAARSRTLSSLPFGMAPIDGRPTQFTRWIILENYQLNAFAECKPSKDASRRPRDEYVLTEAGRDFLPVLFAAHGDASIVAEAR